MSQELARKNEETRPPDGERRENWLTRVGSRLSREVRQHGLSWAVAALTGLLLLFVPKCDKMAQTNENVYFMTADEVPLEGAIVINGAQREVVLDNLGRCERQPWWHEATTLQVYGPANDRGKRKYLGAYPLVKQASGEWQRIRIKFNASELGR